MNKREIFDRKVNLKGGFLTHINVKNFFIAIIKQSSSIPFIFNF